jgi:hypothetical protein
MPHFGGVLPNFFKSCYVKYHDNITICQEHSPRIHLSGSACDVNSCQMNEEVAEGDQNREGIPVGLLP